jgi:hypothetical protein
VTSDPWPVTRNNTAQGRPGYWLLVTGHCLLVTGCAVTPLTNKIDVSEDPFVIGVGEGADSLTDLFAAPAGGGAFVRLTFNRAEERGPRLAPDGLSVAYLRHARGSPEWSVVVLDLVNNAEHSAVVPREAGEPVGLGWSASGDRLVVQAAGFLATRAPGPIRLEPADSTAADSIVHERLGPEGEGLIRRCGSDFCVVVGDSVTPLGPGRSGVIRWGADSMGYFVEGSFEVRPLGGGYARRPAWKDLPSGLRDLTYHGGAQVTTRTGVSGRR